MVSHPEAVRQVFTSSSDVMSAADAVADFLVPILGPHSLLVLDGARHQRERQLMLPPFHGERVQSYGQTMRTLTDRVIDQWPLGRPFRMHRSMQELTLDVIIRVVFGLDEGPDLDRLRECLLRLVALPNSPSAAFLAIPRLRIDLGRFSPWGRFRRDRDEFRSILLGEIGGRRTQGAASRSDILSMLLDARDENGEPMSDDELFDEMLTLLMAGHETSANSLTWIFYNILRRPDVVERLRGEVSPTSGGGERTLDDLPKLEYLDAVIKESARLTPTFSEVARKLKVPMRIAGWDLPAGVTVAPCIYLTHRHPDIWPNPERFDPDRFIGLRPDPFAFLPFGGGDRRCLGAGFATYEMKVILARVLARADLTIAPGYRMRPVLRAVAVGPSKGLPVVLERCRM